MAKTTPVSFTTPTEYGAEEQNIQRQQALADELRRKSEQEIAPGQMVGGWYVPTSPLHYLARGLRGAQARGMEEDARTRQTKLAEKLRTDTAQWASQVPQGSYQGVTTVNPEVDPNAAQQQRYTPPTMEQYMPWVSRGMALGGNAPTIASTMIGIQQRHEDKQMARDQQERELQARFAEQRAARASQEQLRRDLSSEQIASREYVAGQAEAARRDLAAQSNDLRRELRQIGAANQAVSNVVVQDKTSDTGWSHADARTGRITMKNAPPPSGSSERENVKLNAKRQFNMQGIGATISEAEDILSGKGGRPLPTQSGIGSLVDTAAGFFGATPEGAREAERMRAIGGALVSKMPRMEGPQSDKDVMLYKEMAGRIGDSTIPVDRRRAALDEVKRLWEKYEGQNPAAFSGGASNPSIDSILNKYK